MRDLSISVYFARAVLKHAVERGVDPISLLRRNRISPRLLLEDNARISIERFANLQVSTMIAMDDESLGYASRPLPVGCWSMMCHAVIGSETLGQALARYCRFFQLFRSNVALQMEEIEGSIVFRQVQDPTQPPADPYLDELSFFNLHRFASWLVQEHLPMQRVDLTHAAMAEPMDYRHMFLANPLEFEQPQSRILFSPALMEKRVRQNETSLRHFLRHPTLIMLTHSYAGNSWTSNVRDIVRRRLREVPELNDVAATLDVHPQTLRRRLSSEGTTFKDIKNQVRRDTALHFLGKQGLSIEEIAHRAGFSESSAFIRAFKGWTGVTPYTYRKGL